MDWEFFKESELADRKTGECLMDPFFMDKIMSLRRKFAAPMQITSGYRSKETNAAVGGADTSAHLYGKAVDVLIRGGDAYRLVQLAIAEGFTGIGVSQKGSSRFIHLDTMPNSAEQPRPTIWSY
tara:strand:- start:440 stop:811 length:372 start_codon:yes stop_codon:yes gene_type:complete